MLKLIRSIATIWMLLATLTVPAAEPFLLTDTAGVQHRLNNYKGKWLVVNFWAEWCAPCVKEIPDFAALARENGSSVAVLGIAIDWDQNDNIVADTKKVKAFAKKVGLTYPLILADEKSEAYFGKLKGLPTTLVYDPMGVEIFRKTGPVDKALLEKIIRDGKP